MKHSTPKIITSLIFLALLLPAFPGACRGEEIPARKFMATAGVNAFSAIIQRLSGKYTAKRPSCQK